VKYALIAAHRRQFSVVLMCRLLGVSRSGYYAAQRRGPGKRRIGRARLRLHVRAAFAKSRKRYGSPRVHQELRSQGVEAGRRQIADAMRSEGLRAAPKRRFVRTTDSAHAHPIAANRLARKFAPTQNLEVDRVWVSDLTYLPTREGWLYLAVVLDLASRRVVGWRAGNTLEASLAVGALASALWSRRPAAGLLHHSDRGVQYASAEYREVLAQHGAECSMSRKGNCWDNAVAESFFATLEKELHEIGDWQTHAQAQRDLFDFIEVWYNRQRRHSSLGYLSPPNTKSGSPSPRGQPKSPVHQTGGSPLRVSAPLRETRFLDSELVRSAVRASGPRSGSASAPPRTPWTTARTPHACAARWGRRPRTSA
jgi:transposase InsO family protein